MAIRIATLYLGLTLLVLTASACVQSRGNQNANNDPKLVFSLEKSIYLARTIRYQHSPVIISFILLDNGKYTFETATGGFNLCAEKPAGRLQGQLGDKQTRELIATFTDMDRVCDDLDNCSTRNSQAERYWSWTINGWGEYSDRRYRLQGSPWPELFDKVLALEPELYREPERTLSLQLADVSPDQLTLDIQYHGKESFPVVASPRSFVVLGEEPNTSRRLEADNADIRILEGQATVTVELDRRVHRIKDDDRLIYAPVNVNTALYPCASVTQ